MTTRQSWQRTKIVCTLGTATEHPGVIEQLIECGMDVARVNASHGEHADHARRIERVRNASLALGQPVAILLDLPGPKFRIGKLPDNFRKLSEGAVVRLVAEGGITEEEGEAREGSNVLPVRNPELLQALRTGEPVFLADGSIELCVRATTATHVLCEVVIGGTVRSGSGINIPESALTALVPTDDDRRHLAFAVTQAVEWVGVSFVQSASDLARVRECLPGEMGTQPLLIAKIEKRCALADLDAIVEEWTLENGKKQPWYVTRQTDKPIFMAGLSNYRANEPDVQQQKVEVGFVIVTEDCAGGMVDIHDRRPVVLEPEDALRWLDPETPVEEAAHIAQARSLPTEEFVWWKVDRSVNRADPNNNGKHLLAPVS